MGSECGGVCRGQRRESVGKEGRESGRPTKADGAGGGGGGGGGGTCWKRLVENCGYMQSDIKSRHVAQIRSISQWHKEAVHRLQ